MFRFFDADWRHLAAVTAVTVAIEQRAKFFDDFGMCGAEVFGFSGIILDVVELGFVLIRMSFELSFGGGLGWDALDPFPWAFTDGIDTV